MKPVRPVENPYAAIWKSAVTEVLAGHLGRTGPAAGIDAEHPLIEGAERYLEAFGAGRDLPPPLRERQPQAHHQRPAPKESAVDEAPWDPEIAAFLMQLHHRLAHARISGDQQLEAELVRQRERFRFGNPLWEQMLIKYLEYYWSYPSHGRGKPHYRSWQAAGAGAGNPDYGVIAWRLPPRARIALVGDIGTGTDVAAAVLLAALSFRPEAILHAGDVYYSGTRFEVAHRWIGLFESAFAAAGRRVPVFTVPGNHEYFTGGGAFLDCLDGGRLAAEPAQRQAASYFCLRSADQGWQFLGLDTGFHGHTMSIPPAAKQDALRRLHARDAVPPPAEEDMVRLREDEELWHRHQIESFGGRTILLSHHQLYSAAQACGTPQATVADKDGKTVPEPGDFNRAWVNTALWRQLGPHFGGRVAAWFWGHEHNLGIFADGYRPADWPAGAGEASEVFRTLPKGRCVGHSAIPVEDRENPYDEKYPVPLKGQELRLGLTGGWYNRGFEFLELGGAGRPCRVAYYQIVEAAPTPLLIHEETVT